MIEMGLASDTLPRSRGEEPVGLTIRVSGGVGTGRTALSAFDAALRDAGVANFNLVRLSSVIPPGSNVVDVRGDEQLTGGHGDLLYCVYAVDVAMQRDETVWAGVGWSLARDGSGGGLFVEHTAAHKDALEHDLAASLDDMARSRGGQYAPAGSVLASATCTGTPAAAVVVATYKREGW
jgi:arginine decarboxylase